MHKSFRMQASCDASTATTTGGRTKGSGRTPSAFYGGKIIETVLNDSLLCTLSTCRLSALDLIAPTSLNLGGPTLNLIPFWYTYHEPINFVSKLQVAVHVYAAALNVW